MPIYEFECDKCGLITTTIQSYKADAPTCCDRPTRRLMGKPALISIGGITPFLRDMSNPDSAAFNQEKRYRNRRAG